MVAGCPTCQSGFLWQPQLQTGGSLLTEQYPVSRQQREEDCFSYCHFTLCFSRALRVKNMTLKQLSFTLT